jgi:hypothetical protein
MIKKLSQEKKDDLNKTHFHAFNENFRKKLSSKWKSNFWLALIQWNLRTKSGFRIEPNSIESRRTELLIIRIFKLLYHGVIWKKKSKHNAGEGWVVFWSIQTFIRRVLLTKNSSFDFYYPVFLAKISNIHQKIVFFYLI